MYFCFPFVSLLGGEIVLFDVIINVASVVDENDKLELINTNMGMENQSMNSASTITQKWEQDARKDPEEEYFRLVSDSLA